MSEEIKEGYTRVSDLFSRYESFGDVDPEYLKLRARVGTGVHKAIYNTLNFIPFELQADEKGYYNSWFRWYEKTNPSITNAETRMYCDKLMLTGAIDGVVSFPNSGDKMIVDWKTSSSANDIVWSAKGAFYHYLVKQSNLCELCDKVLYLKLDRDGGYPITREYEITKYLKSLVIVITMAHRFYEKANPRRKDRGES